MIQTSFQALNWNKYDFVLNSYYGTGGFCDGSYLFSHQRELDFESRRKQCYYKNYISGILNSTIEPVFSQPALRETNNATFEAFLSNVDNNNTPIQPFVEHVITMARLLGSAFIVMDSMIEVPTNEKQAIDNRLYPYIYTKLPQDVYSYTTNKYGALESITFFMEEMEDGVKTYMYWDNTCGMSQRFINGELVTTSKYDHNFGAIPVIVVKDTEQKGILIHPPYYDMARLNMTIFNQDSEQRDLERVQGFSMLVVPGTQPDTDVEIGSHNLIYIDSDASQSPKYIAPDANVLATLRTSSEHNVDALINMANVLGSTAVNNGNSTKSGTAMAFEFVGQNFQLLQTSTLANKIENDIAKMFGFFINKMFDYTVHYRSDYAPSSTVVLSKLAILKEITESFSEYMDEDDKVAIKYSIKSIISYATNI